MANGFNFHDKLMAATLTPLTIVVLVVLWRCVRRLSKGGPVMEGTAVKYMLLMLYFGIATISTIVAKAFQYTEFDGIDSNGEPMKERFLTAVSHLQPKPDRPTDQLTDRPNPTSRT